MIKLALAGLVCAAILAVAQIVRLRRRRMRRRRRRDYARRWAAYSRTWDEVFGRWKRRRLPYDPNPPEN